MSARIVRVDLHEKRELDLAAQVARVRAGTRPWRSIIAFALAVLAAIASWAFPHYQLSRQTGQLTADIVTHATAVAFFLFAVAALIGLSGKARQLLRPLIGSAHAAVVRYTIVLAGSILILIVTLDLLQIAVGSLVLGGAVTTILLGIAAQQSLGNLFAGIVLLLSRPFAVGDSVEIRSGALGGPLQGIVTEIGITYVRLDTPDGVLHLPNSQMLAAGVGQPSQRPSAQPSPDPQPPSLP
ncbi:MAG TPA: mechanosensitive ion channel domain-containing protein [Streptosporangiaceae bacterium]|nr:mechanosensitive ion channel domain-containing protein [Streptosporangiaceae bacterium]